MSSHAWILSAGAGLCVAIAWIIVPIVTPWADRWGLRATRAYPGEAPRRVVCAGGLVLWVTASLCVLVFWINHSGAWSGWLMGGWLGCGLLAVLVGLWDDRCPIGPWVKLIAQTLIAVLASVSGWRAEILMLPDWASAFLSVVWLVVIMNAVNYLDVVDGLAVQVTGAMTAGVLAIAWSSGVLSSMYLAVALLGALVGLLRWNRSPAVMWLGDSGSLLLGIWVGSLSVRILVGGVGQGIGVFIPWVLCAVPVTELLFATLVRYRAGRSIVCGGPDHFVFRLLARGWSEHVAVDRLTAVAMLCAGLAWIMHSTPQIVMCLVLTLVGVGGLWIVWSGSQMSMKGWEQWMPTS